MNDQRDSHAATEAASTSDPLRRLTDIANAKRFVEQHGAVLRWLLGERHWLVWDGLRWRAAAVEEVEALAKMTATSIWEEIATTDVSDQRMDIARHAKQSESAHAVRAMVRLSTSDLRVMVRRWDLDRDPYLFNCLNGTIRLGTNTLLPHDPANLITKLAPVEYDRSARCPTWMAFLKRVMDGNDQLIRFIQRALGYSLSGDVTEQCFFFLYGLGENGKTTFMETIRAILGAYAMHADSSTFLLQRADSVRNDIARLAGARFVSAAEFPRGRAIDENLVKQLTGGGMVTARHLFKDLFEFTPQCKIWIEGNHKPEIAGMDHAIWRRVRIIPFKVTITPAERDPALGEQLRHELPGILNWMLAGYQAWAVNGLAPPSEVRQATDEYRVEMDPLAEFIADCCVLSAEQSITKHDLLSWYRWWCQGRGVDPMSAKAFGTSIGDRGIDELRTSSARFWRGIGVRPDAGSDA